MRLLAYSNSPTCPTGFGTVMRNIFLPLHREQFFAEMNFYGVNFFGEPHDLPFRIWPAQVAGGDKDLYGRGRFAWSILDQNNWAFDVLFLLEDHFTLAWPIQFPDGRVEPFIPGLIRRLREQVKEGKRSAFKVVQYIPVDSETVRPEWVMSMPQLIDKPVAYTHFGKRVLSELVPALAAKLRVIPHGTNPENFFPLDPELRRHKRKTIPELALNDEDPLIVNVNRNQPRKDVVRTVHVFRKVLDHYPTAKLYLHMNVRDSMGFDLEAARLNLRIPSGKVIFPGNFSEGRGLPVDALNVVYNLGDVFVTTARGEGWGLSVSECMTAGVMPIVAPDHTSYSEILSDGRGQLVPPLPVQEIMIGDNDQLRPVADVDAMAAAVCSVLANPELARGMCTLSREWALGLSWEQAVVPMWQQVFIECKDELGLGVRRQSGNRAFAALQEVAV